MSKPTSYQLLATFSRHTGETVTLGRYDRIEALEVTDSTITLLVETHRYTERSREDRLTAKGLRMISYSPKGRRVIESWDDDFTPVVVRHYGSVSTPDEYYDKRDWEALCARPGDASRFGGRDSVPRTVQRVEDRLSARITATATLFTTSQPE